VTQKLFVIGNEAVGWGALMADCDAFFGYPITPQNEITEWFAREYPTRGKIFFQTTSETSTINMLYGGAAYGARVMTATSSPGWALMQETMSHMVDAELPAVVVLVQRGGPGQGTTRQAQMDYFTATRGGGQGGYKNIVLCPASVQETHDLVQLAFFLADKYRNPVIVLTDAVIGVTTENLEVRRIDFGSLPAKDWAVRGLENQPDGQGRLLTCSQGYGPNLLYPNFLSLLTALDKKYKMMTEAELRYETHQVDDAELVLVAYGYPSRVCHEALEMARDEGLNVGLIRLITAWPFPYQVLREKAQKGSRFLVVEDSLGQMLEDVKLGIEGKNEVYFLGTFARHLPTETGLIFPERVMEEIRRIL
jgi:2-oxoglutarate ferredoxin oxidoreductase subunit alpha